MKYRLMPVAKMTRQSNTGIARERLLFRRLASIGESVRFVLFPILIDGFLLAGWANHSSRSPVAITFNLVHTGWEPRSTPFMIRGCRVGCRVVAKTHPIRSSFH